MKAFVDLKDIAERTYRIIDLPRRKLITERLERNKYLLLKIASLLAGEPSRCYRTSLFDWLTREERDFIRNGIDRFKAIVDFGTDDEHYFLCLLYFWNILSHEEALTGKGHGPAHTIGSS